jgi:hypothetical protein
MEYFTCANTKCKNQTVTQSAAKIGKNTKCGYCKKKQITKVAAPTKIAVDHFAEGVDDLMNRFVVDEHQSKHYEGGESGAAQFLGMGFQEVHKLIVKGTRKILEKYDEDDAKEVSDGFVEISDAKMGWSDGKRGTTSYMKIQLGCNSSGFSGHGYPVSHMEWQANTKLPKTSIKSNAWASLTLSTANTERRRHK